MSKIALCFVMCGKIYQSHDQLGLSSIAGELVRNDHEVDFFHISEKNETQILTEIAQYQPKFVGFTIYSDNALQSLEFSKKLKKHINCLIVFGGPTPTFEGKLILHNESVVDYIVKGEGEFIFSQLIDKINNNLSLVDCEGVVWRNEKNEVIDNLPAPLLDCLDKLPFPYRMKRKFANVAHFNLETSRGCLGNCSFCNSKYSRLQSGKVWRGKSIGRVINEIENSIKEGVNRFNIVDLSFQDPGSRGKKRILEFAEIIKKNQLKINYTVHLRAEFVTENNLSIIYKLIESGMSKVILGIEAGNSNSLKVYNKIASVEDNRNAINILNNIEIPTIHGFIHFNPYSSIDDLLENAKFLYDCHWAYRIEDFCIKTNIFPGTALKQQLIHHKLIPTDFCYKNNPSDYTFVNQKVYWLNKVFSTLLQRRNIDSDFGLYTHSFIFETTKIFKKSPVPKLIQDSFNNLKTLFHNITNEMNSNHYIFFVESVKLVNKSDSYKEFEQEYFQLENELIGDTIHNFHAKIENNKLKFAWLCKKNNITIGT
jgi:anaerobic magnesium-protoporphyrin IX monomethyl ester cyclase